MRKEKKKICLFAARKLIRVRDVPKIKIFITETLKIAKKDNVISLKRKQKINNCEVIGK